MSKSRFNPPKPPRRSTGPQRILTSALLLALGAAAGAYASHQWTRGIAAAECRLALQAQLASPAEATPTPVVAPLAAASQAEPASAAASSAEAPRETISASPAPEPASGATGSKPIVATEAAVAPAAAAAPKAAEPPQKLVSPKPVQRNAAPQIPSAPPKAVQVPKVAPLQPAKTLTGQQEPAPPGRTPTQAPSPASAATPLPAFAQDTATAAPALVPGPASPRVAPDMTPRNPQVIARNGDVVFLRINEKTTLQVKKGASVQGLGTLQTVDADGAHFDTTVIPLAK